MTDIEQLMSDTASWFEAQLMERELRAELVALFDAGQTPTMVRNLHSIPRGFLNMVLVQVAPGG